MNWDTCVYYTRLKYHEEIDSQSYLTTWVFLRFPGTYVCIHHHPTPSNRQCDIRHDVQPINASCLQPLGHTRICYVCLIISISLWVFWWDLRPPGFSDSAEGRKDEGDLLLARTGLHGTVGRLTASIVRAPTSIHQAFAMLIATQSW